MTDMLQTFVDDSGRKLVHVSIVSDDEDPSEMSIDVAAISGFQEMSRFKNRVSGWLPIDSLEAVQHAKSLSKLKAIIPPITHTGSVDGGGDEAMRADLARGAYSVDGSGIKVGVLSDSYNCLRGANADIASGDLPPNGQIDVIEELPFCSGGIDEGRAMMQLIHDVAPMASMSFHTAFESPEGFAQGIIDLADDGCDVIVDDVIFFTEPMFEDGIIAQAVDQVVARGIPYFSSAGNSGRNSWEATSGFVSSEQSYGDFGVFHSFGSSAFQRLAVSAGTLSIVVQWDQPFGAVENDVDVFLFTLSGGSLREVARSAASNPATGEPVEIIQVNVPAPATVFLGITLYSGPAPGFMKYVYFGSATILDDVTNSPSSYGHANARGCCGVGAADHRQTPRNGQDPAIIEGFSSAGGVPILFASGERLTSPEVRMQPKVVGPDGTLTTFFPPGTNRFFGTSAAAPHVAAVAGLMLQRNGALTPSEIYEILQSTAKDMDDPSTPSFDSGFDYGTGYGLVDALTALADVPVGTPTCDIDSPCDAIEATVDGQAIGFSTEVCTAESSAEVDFMSGVIEQSTWVSFVAPSTGCAQIEATINSPASVELALFSSPGGQCNSFPLTELSFTDDSSDLSILIDDESLVAGRRYFVMVNSAAGTLVTGSVTVSNPCEDEPPVDDCLGENPSFFRRFLCRFFS
mmetsp:Transcript_22118/g.33747  ORF Transcript_22118/g.33747 Transcript_22118/m.33747 type:complete len:688 (+) Transcript_22118:321-2384(+)